MSQRLKGQEVRITFNGPGGLEEGLTDIQNFEAEFQEEILTEGYLGETTNRRDDIFNGVSGSAELHIQQAAYYRFVQRVKDRSQRRTPATGVFNILARMSFPNGETVRMLFENVFFGPLPTRVSGRGEYVQVRITFESEDGRFLF